MCICVVSPPLALLTRPLSRPNKCSQEPLLDLGSFARWYQEERVTRLIGFGLHLSQLERESAKLNCCWSLIEVWIEFGNPNSNKTNQRTDERLSKWLEIRMVCLYTSWLPTLRVSKLPASQCQPFTTQTSGYYYLEFWPRFALKTTLLIIWVCVGKWSLIIINDVKMVEHFCIHIRV